MNLLLFKPEELDQSLTFTVHDRRAKHLLEIKKIKAGDHVRVGEVNGKMGSASVVETTAHSVTLQVTGLSESNMLPDVDLILALPRPQILKSVLKTVAMLGVRRLILTRSARVEKSYFQSSVLTNYQEFLALGLEQAVATRLPQVLVYQRFQSFVREFLSAPVETTGKGVMIRRLLADPRATQSLLQVMAPDICSEISANSLSAPTQPQLIVAIGPEGGWQEHELSALKEFHFTPFQLGQRILRVETAVTYILGQLALLYELRLQQNAPCDSALPKLNFSLSHDEQP